MSLFISIILFANIVSANYGNICINCPNKGVISYTEKCDITGKHFRAGTYNWTIVNNYTIIKTGKGRVDNTGNICIKNIIPEDCEDYGINFGYATYNYKNSCQSPIVPEFGLITGITAMLGAVGLFLMVRRKNE